MIINANDDANVGGPDSIVFDLPVVSTIDLDFDDLRITDGVVIDGSGVNNDLGWENLTIDAGGNSRIFDVLLQGNDAQAVTITDLSLTDGSASVGGAINARIGTNPNSAVHSLTLDRLRVYDNQVTQNGGGIDAQIGDNDLLAITN